MTTSGDGSGRDEPRDEPDTLDLSGSVEAAGGMGGPFMAAPPGADVPSRAGDPSVDFPPDPYRTDPGGQPAPPDLGPSPAPGERPFGSGPIGAGQDGYEAITSAPESTGSGADGGLEAAANRPGADPVGDALFGSPAGPPDVADDPAAEFADEPLPGAGAETAPGAGTDFGAPAAAPADTADFGAPPGAMVAAPAAGRPEVPGQADGGGHPAGSAGAGSSGMLDEPDLAAVLDLTPAGPTPSTTDDPGPARRLRERGGSAVGAVRSAARRRPAVFLAGAVVAGAAASRIVAAGQRNGR